MKEKDSGSVTLELSIVLPIFILMFLFIYGIFSIVMAKNTITHALVQSAKSLSLDSYMNEEYESIKEPGINFWGGLGDVVVDLIRLTDDPYYSSSIKWYENGQANDVAKKRFIGFFAGGDESAAEELAENLKVENGLNGLEITATVEGETLSLNAKYNLKYWFDFWGYGTVPVDQTIKTRLWK